MKTIRVDRYRVTKKVLDQATEVLKNGGVVVYPTETAYGLAADSTNPDAIEKIYKIKGRPKEKRLPLVV